jgi:hypothetical protein
LADEAARKARAAGGGRRTTPPARLDALHSGAVPRAPPGLELPLDALPAAMPDQRGFDVHAAAVRRGATPPLRTGAPPSPRGVRRFVAAAEGPASPGRVCH